MTKTALILTGAGSRISQQTALLYRLEQNWAKRSWWGKDSVNWAGNTLLADNIQCLAGTSSGALNLTALNAIWNHDSSYSWDDYIHFLTYELRNELIRMDNPDFPPLPPVYSTDQFEHTMTKELTNMGFSSMGYREVPLGALVYPSYISVMKVGLPSKVCFLSSWDDFERGDNRIRLIDTLLCTTAIPLIFPPRQLRTAEGCPLEADLPENLYVDGGMFNGIIPIEPILRKHPYPSDDLNKIIVISPMRAELNPQDLFPDYTKARTIGVKEVFDFWLNSLNLRRVIQMLRKVPDAWKDHVYVYLPDLTVNFDILDFSAEEQRKQFIEAYDWSEDHAPVRLSEYLSHAENLYPEMAEDYSIMDTFKKLGSSKEFKAPWRVGKDRRFSITGIKTKGKSS